MRAVVTGASGFVGFNLVRDLLTSGHTVTVLERDAQMFSRLPAVQCSTVRGELEDMKVCDRLIVEHRPDVIYHLAAQAIVGHANVDPVSTMESNVRGTYNLLESFRRYRTFDSVMVVASSDKAYGEMRVYADGAAPYREDDPLMARGIYDVSKACADMIAQSYAHSYCLPIGIVRAGNIYGPGDADKTRIIPSVLDDIANDRSPVIRSDGSPVRDYLYIADAVSAYKAVADYLMNCEIFPRAHAFNFSGGEPVSVIELVLRIMELAQNEGLKVKPPLITRETGGGIKCQVLDTAKARNVLDWQPAFSLTEGLIQTMCAWGILSSL